MEDADNEAERVDAEPCPSDVFIFAAIDPRLMIHYLEITSVSGIVLIAIGCDNDQKVRSSLVVHYVVCTHSTGLASGIFDARRPHRGGGYSRHLSDRYTELSDPGGASWPRPIA
jgi:hypothetical protein